MVLGLEAQAGSTSLIQALLRHGYDLDVEGDRLRIRPADRVDDTLAELLTQHELLPIVLRLVAMRRLARVAPKAVVYASPEARGGPGRCFSCGDPLEHPTAYGRCGPCDVAADLFYSRSVIEESAGVS